MKTGKRFLSIFLATLMLLTAAPLTGFVGLEVAPKAGALDSVTPPYWGDVNDSQTVNVSDLTAIQMIVSGSSADETFENRCFADVDLNGSVDETDTGYISTFIANHLSESETFKFPAESLAKITLNPPSKTTYFIGESLDTAGMNVVVENTNDPSVRYVLTENITVTGFDSSTVGTKHLTATFRGLVLVFDIVIIEKTLPFWGDVNGDGAIDDIDVLMSARIEAGLESGTVEQLCFADVDLDGCVSSTHVTATQNTDLSTCGDVELMAAYCVGLTSGFPADALATFLLNPPLKTSYSIGEPFDQSGLSITVRNSNNVNIKYVLTDHITIDGFDSAVAGTKHCTASFRGMTFSFDVTVKATERTCLADLECTKEGHYTGNNGDSRVYKLDGTEFIGVSPKGFRDAISHNGNISVGGESLQNGLEVWLARWLFKNNEISYAYRTFKLNGAYKRLTGKSDLIKSKNIKNFDCLVSFYDGDTLLHSFHVTSSDYQQAFSVDVTNVNELKVLVKDCISASGGTSIALHDLFLDDPKNPALVFPDGTDYYTYVGETQLYSVEDSKAIFHDIYYHKSNNSIYSVGDITLVSSNPAVLEVKRTGSFQTVSGTEGCSFSIRALAVGRAIVTASLPNGVSSSICVEVRGSEYYMIVSSSHQSCSVPIGEAMLLAIREFKNGKEITPQHDYIVSFSKDGLFELTSQYFEKTHCELKIQAKKQGSCIMTINDASTGAVFSTTVTAAKELNVYRFNNLPKYEYQKGRLTNFFNVDGLFIDSFGYSSTFSTDYYDVSFNAFNQALCYGVAVSYDKNGNIYDMASIEAEKDMPEGFIENVATAAWEVYDLTHAWVNDDPYYYSGPGFSKHTSVSITVPKDGYLLITNNTKNEVCYFVNLTAYLIGAAFASAGLITSAASLDWTSAVDHITKEMLRQCGKDLFVDYVKEAMTNFTGDYTKEMFEDSVRTLVDVLKRSNIDYLDVLKNSVAQIGCTLSETMLTSIISTGAIISLMYSVFKSINLLEMFNSFVEHRNANRIVIYPPVNEETNEYISNGIKVTQGQALDGNYVLHTYALAENHAVILNAKNSLDSISPRREVFNITLYKNGEEAQPGEKISVYIPIPSDFNKEEIVVYWLKDDGSLQIMNTHVENNYAVFTSDHLSNYVLFDKSVPHTHAYTSSVTKEPTCTEKGVRTYTCSCGDSYTKAIKALGHDYVTHEAQAPTCTEKGWGAYKTCTRCDYSSYREKAALGHVDKNNDGKCDRCKQQMTGDDVCPQCGKVHKGFFDKIVGFFHKLIYRLTHLFG